MRFDQNGWLDAAVEIDYLNKSMPREGHAIKYIVLHSTAGGSSAQAIGEYFRDSNVDASAHLIIDQAGVVVQGVNLLAAAWGNGILTPGHASYLPEDINPNLYTVSIEHVKPSTDNSDVLTDIQEQKSFEVIQCICDTYGVPKRVGDANGGIIRHADIDPINRARCPGPYPFDKLYAFLGQGGQTSMGVPQGWTDDGTTLTAPNGHKVVKGFRDFVLQGWDKDNWPLTEEYGQTPLELSNPTQGGGTQQIFRWDMLGYTPAKGVFVEWIGQEVLALRQELTRHQQGAPDQAALSKRLADQQQALQQVLPLSEQITALVKPFEAS